jgi:hypothetical protein
VSVVAVEDQRLGATAARDVGRAVIQKRRAFDRAAARDIDVLTGGDGDAAEYLAGADGAGIEG